MYKRPTIAHLVYTSLSSNFMISGMSNKKTVDKIVLHH